MPLSILQFVDSENTTTNFSVDVDFFAEPINVTVNTEFDLTLSFFQPNDFRPCLFVDNTVSLADSNKISFEADVVFGDTRIIVTNDNYIFVELDLIEAVVANDWISTTILDYDVTMYIKSATWWPMDVESVITDENSWVEATSTDGNSSAYWG